MTGQLMFNRSLMHEHNGSLHDLIEVMGKLLTAASIMTPWLEVESIEGENDTRSAREDAISLMNAHQFSGVPVVAGGAIHGAYIRHQPDCVPLFEPFGPSHVVDPSMGLIDLIRHMRENQRIVVAVGSEQEPLGWLTYADFSKRPFRVLLFAIVAEVEYLLARALDIVHFDDSWVELLNEGDSKNELLGKKAEAQSWDVTMPLTTFAEIGHLIQAVPRSSRVLELLVAEDGLGDRLKSLPDIRNNVAHVVRPIVTGPKKIRPVANQIDLLLRLIREWPARLEGAH